MSRWQRLSPEARERARARNRAWRRAYTEKYGIDAYRAWTRDQNLKAKYGVTNDEIQKLLDSQGGKCAICKTVEFDGPGKMPHVDHCHLTNTIRGLLCIRCNTAIGLFGENPELMARASRYINTSRRWSVTAAVEAFHAA